MKRYFHCTVCDDIHFGENPPEICPTCETMSSYKGVTKDEAAEDLALKVGDKVTALIKSTSVMVQK